jgi:hypothetical protein
MIKIITIDGKIWNKDQATIDIISAMLRREQPVRISLNGEGPCADHVGLYDLLDRICSAQGWPKQAIEIETANFLEQHVEYQIRHVHQEYELRATQDLFKKDLSTSKQFDNILHFGHFIGHSNQHRLHLASYLYAEHSDQTLHSYNCCVTEPYHREHIGLEAFMANGADAVEIGRAHRLLSAGPLPLDLAPLQNTISVPNTLGVVRYYPQFFVELVSLGFYSGQTFYVDEKIWRPVLMRTPFIVQGPQNLIPNLRRLGFETFHEFWDEGYSEDPSDCQVRAIIAIVQALAKKTNKELEDMYTSMLPKLEHNRNLLKDLTANDFNRVFQQ